MSGQVVASIELLSAFRTSVDCGLFSTTATTKTTYGPYVASHLHAYFVLFAWSLGGTAAGCATEYECSFTDGVE